MSDPRPAALAPVVSAETLRERGLRECLGADRVVLELGFGRAELLLDLAKDSLLFLGERHADIIARSSAFLNAAGVVLGSQRWVNQVV